MTKSIQATEYLNYEGDSFSKVCNSAMVSSIRSSVHSRAVWASLAIKPRTRACLRMCSASICSTSAQRHQVRAQQHDVSSQPLIDTSFDWSDLVAKHNNELLTNLGNFVNRALAFVDKTFEGVVPAIVSMLNCRDSPLMFVKELTDVELQLIASVDREVC